MARTSNRKYPFPTVSHRRTYEYDATSVAAKENVLTIGRYYDSKSMCVDLTEDLYADKLYKKVVEGSLRWWLFERRRFDHKWFEESGSLKTPSLVKCNKHEEEWKKKINDWYEKYEFGLSEAPEKIAEKAPSKYKLNKYCNNNDMLSIREACGIGKNPDGSPRFYRIYKEGDEVCKVECLIGEDNLSTINGVGKYSEKWWTIERMKYDFGDPLHPVAKDFGMVSGDWRGVYEKFKYIWNKTSGVDFETYHERGWIQWVNAHYRSSETKSYTKKRTVEDRYTHNVAVLKELHSIDLNQIATVLPEIILECMPPAYCKAVLEYVISIIEDKYVVSKDAREGINTIKEVLSRVRKANVKIADCPNIEIATVTLAAGEMSRESIGAVLSYASSKLIEYNMIPVKDEREFSRAIGSISSLRSKGNDYSESEKYGINNVDWFAWNDHRLVEVFEQKERARKSILKKYKLGVELIDFKLKNGTFE